MLESIIPPLADIIEKLGYIGIFILMTLESAAIPIPSEIVVTFAGFLAGLNRLDFKYVIIFSTLANLTGSYILYLIGSKIERKSILRIGKYILLDENHLEFVEDLFNKYGGLIVFIGRLMPGVRTYISLPAGFSRMPITPFISLTLLGSLIWNFILAYIGYILGCNWIYVVKYIDYIAIAVLIILIIILSVYYRRWRI